MFIRSARIRALCLATSALVLVAAACGDDGDSTDTTQPAASATAETAAAPSSGTLKISAIPDQDPEKLAARDGAMATYLSAELGVEVEYVPVTDYAASVSLFKTGDLDLVFYGGLTGVQARLQTPGATLIAQRDIDEAFESVFIANAASGIAPITSVAELTVFEGKRFTFGSESSTSGRLMPEYFLDQAGIDRDNDFAGAPGYSGSHDKTIDLVAAGSYDGGALNRAVWEARLAAGTVDTTNVIEVFVSPPYHDYHWVAGPATDERFGAGFTERITAALLALDKADPADAEVLAGYSAGAFVPTTPDNYVEIEAIGRKLGLIS